jgi:hypothetical protein
MRVALSADNDVPNGGKRASGLYARFVDQIETNINGARRPRLQILTN